MRTKYTFPIIMMSGLFIMQSCSKSSQKEIVLASPAAGETINATVAANAVYELKLESYGTVRISKQAAHFKESSTGVDSKTGILVYTYSPAADFRGEDEVVLQSTKEVTMTNSGDYGCNINKDNNSTASFSNEINTTVNRFITVKLRVID